MTIKLTTLTPLWTGGIDSKKTDRIHITGIIGSLRWWYEVIVRGMGARACDPVRDPCQLQQEQFMKLLKRDSPDKSIVAAAQSGLCGACQYYGATGWARRFHLGISGTIPMDFSGTFNIRPQGRNNGWYLGPGLVGDLLLKVKDIGNPEHKYAALIPLDLAMQWGGIGARVQNGYGVIGFSSRNEDDFQLTTDAFNALPTGSRARDELPDLRDFFFMKLRFRSTSNNWWQACDGLASTTGDHRKKLQKWIDSSGSVPVAPVLKNFIRFNSGLASGASQALQNFLFGTIKSVCPDCYNDLPRNSFYCRACRKEFKKEEICERVAAKINVSSAYPPVADDSNLWEIRIWGWLPSTLPARLEFNNSTRSAFLRKLHDLFQDTSDTPWSHLLGTDLTTDHQFHSWQTYDDWRNSSGDDSVKNYLISLLERSAS